jgi:hypothetical protein
MMKYLILVKAVLLMIIAAPSFAAGPAVCTKVGGEITQTGASFCRLGLNEITINLRYVGLCTSEPDESNYQTKCSAIFASASGQDVSLTATTGPKLSDSASLPEGTYTHAYILIDNQFSYRTIAKFSTSRTGKTGSGAYCWSLAGNANTTIAAGSNTSGYLADCGSSAPATAGLSERSFTAFYDFSGNSGWLNISNGTNPSGTYYTKLLDVNGVAAQVNVSSAASNADHIAGLQTYTNPITIDMNTTAIDIGFKLTDTGGVSLEQPTISGSPEDHVTRFGLGGFEFAVTVN